MSDVQNEVINEAVESIPEEVVDVVVDTKPAKGSILPSPETIGQNVIGGVVTSVATAVLVKSAGYVAGRVVDGTRFLAGKVRTKLNDHKEKKALKKAEEAEIQAAVELIKETDVEEN